MVLLNRGGSGIYSGLSRAVSHRSMIAAEFIWPEGLAPDTLCFSVDVEWAHATVLADVKSLFDQHGVAATFFVTHAGVSVSGHERGLHPNFRRNGDTYRALAQAGERSDLEVQEHVIATTLAFAPEAKGVRTHSLYYDSTLLPIYRRHGIEYDCSYQMPFVAQLRPFWKHDAILEIPTYYADHLDLLTHATGFETARLGLDRPGIKVFDFHPNMVYLNAADNASYAAAKAFYHDPERLLGARHNGRGVRTLLLDLLAHVRRHDLPTATLGKVNALVRQATVPPRARA
jgi:hypothetical protein